MLAQIPIAPSGAIESWLLSAAAIASMALLVKKLFWRTPGQAEFVTQTDLHREMTSVRDKIDARFFLLSEKLDEVKSDLLAAGERRSASIQSRLNDLETMVARVDERTKPAGQSPKPAKPEIHAMSC